MNNEEMNDYLKSLILNNFVAMLNRKNKQEITEYMNSSDMCFSLMSALGSNITLFEEPAHSEQIEACFKNMMKSIIEVIGDEEAGLKLYLLENGLLVHSETRRICENIKLQFDDDSYSYEKTCNIGETLKKVKGSVDKKLIVTYSEERDSSRKTLETKKLDEFGFVISQTIEGSDGNENSIYREGVSIKSGDNIIKWDGNPFGFNIANTNYKTFFNNMISTISKYPTKGIVYYKGIVGEDMVKKALSIIRDKNI